MTDRILTWVNVLLALVSVGFLYYILTAKYEEPAEIAAARAVIARTETDYAPGTGIAPAPPAGVIARPSTAIRAEMMKSIYTPTPTPTPTPSPTPQPPILEQAVLPWHIQEISSDGQTVIFLDERSNTETITLKVGGPPYEGPLAVDQSGRQVPVTLQSIDLGEAKASLVFQDQMVIKSMF